jgi:hypothetical protein
LGAKEKKAVMLDVKIQKDESFLHFSLAKNKVTRDENGGQREEEVM